MIRVSRFWILLALAVTIPQVALSAGPAKSGKEPSASIGLFEGLESGDLEVKVIPRDSKEGTITIKNTSGKPLTIKLPEAFAGVPVLAQGLLGGAGGGNNNNNNGGGGNQGFGGGMMGGGMGGMGGMMGGGMFNVEPEKVGKLKVVLVCLDHGKRDPSPQVPYRLVPIESYAKNEQVIEVVKMLSRREIDQHSAQAAAWHLQNGLTWEQLVRKIGVKHLSGAVEPYFTAMHLQRALAATKLAQQRAEQASSEKSPGKISGQ